MVQFGISVDDVESTKRWQRQSIKDEPLTALEDDRLPRHSNSRGTLTFAMSGPNTRSCQLFINLGSNAYLDKEGFVPIGYIVYGSTDTLLPGEVRDRDVLSRIYTGYGECGKGDGADGKGPSQGWLMQRHPEKGLQLRQKFPLLSYIKSAQIL